MSESLDSDVWLFALSDDMLKTNPKMLSNRMFLILFLKSSC